ncbi:carboxymuconolactone decarboxylase family protein [Lacisediminimonas sp.]|uniref:carboxymuconolactone decarboxylase family protein n=1 Tax=Lacisediminimonas sp. TaxID=3060582 RepID=UPI002724039D|nr:carboxymuconolactone decarboxylase family protein [Lacisediminimonas sp.]MDO8299954.1 carboxymuconolactone decarboxylase family protein [Lacisediminimonas sp.]
MARIPYQPADIAEPKAVVDAVRARRGGGLLNLDRMLLHSPALARGWNAFLGEVRTGLSVSPRLREIGMCVVAMLNGAEYEFFHHAPELIKAGGTEEQVQALRDPVSALGRDDLFTPIDLATIRVTIEMTRDVQVSDAAFDALRVALGSEQELVELVAVVAAYNMVSRFLVALGVEPE